MRRVAGSWATDDSGVDIVINGFSTGNQSSSFSSLTSFTINSSHLQTGLNTLEFQVQNNGANPTGLLVDGLSLTDPVIKITGSGLNDSLVINATSATSGTYRLSSGGVLGPLVTFTGVNTFTFDDTAGTGNSSLTINNPAGGLFAPANGITYLGDHSGTLSDLGGAADLAGSYVPSAQARAR